MCHYGHFLKFSFNKTLTFWSDVEQINRLQNVLSLIEVNMAKITIYFNKSK